MKVSIINTPGGNKGSVISWVKRSGSDFNLIDTASQIRESEIIIFPGNGTFKSTISWIEEKNFSEALIEYINSNNKYIGLCIGMQIMFEKGFEGGIINGLNILKGEVEELQQPRIGWEKVLGKINKFRIDSDYFFMHKYGVLRKSRCLDFVRYKNSYLFQFHPEKSGISGDKLLQKILFKNYV